MSPDRIAEARAVLEAWDPDAEVLPDWVADALDEEPSLAALFDARFTAWDAGDLGGRRVAVPPRPRLSIGHAVLAATFLFAVGTPMFLYLDESTPPPVVVAKLGPVPAEEDEEEARASDLTPTEPVGRVARDPDPTKEGGSTRDVALPPSTGDGTGHATATASTSRGERGDGHRVRWWEFESAPPDEARRLQAIDGLRSLLAEGTESAQPPRVVVQRSAVEVREHVYFEGGETAPRPEADPVLDAVADVLKHNPELGRVVVEGHTNGQGTETWNQELSLARANAVRDALVVRGVPPERLEAVGHGEHRPIAPDTTAEGRERNARVEFRLAGQDDPVAEPVVEPPSEEDYTDYGHHAFVRTADDTLSTFSIDVDTASYAIARRKLQEGWLPPPASVRVEEFVNYFPYDYARPPDDAPFGIDAEGVPSPFNARTHLVRIGVQGKRVPVDQRRPVHLTFLVDTSGSMQSDDKLGLAKQALVELTGELRDGDTVAIVAYAGSAGLVLPPTPTSRRAEIVGALERLQAGGSTAMGAGIELAYRLADQTLHDGAHNRVVLLSDGDANVGVTSHEGLGELIRSYADKGITLTTAGFGEGNYKDTTMERLANDGDGNYWYIDSLDQARRVFVDRLTGTLVEIARDVKIQVEWNAATVEAYRLVGYENRDIADVDFRNDRVDAGEIGAGHQVTAIYELALREGASGALGTVRVRSKPPGPDAPSVERTYPLDAEVIRPAFAEGSRDLRLAIGAASFAELLRGSPHAHDATYADVARIVREARRVEYDEDVELVGLIERAATLSGP